MREVHVSIGRATDQTEGWLTRDDARELIRVWRVQGRRIFRKRITTSMGPAIRYRIWFSQASMGSHVLTILRRQGPSPYDCLTDDELLAALTA